MTEIVSIISANETAYMPIRQELVYYPGPNPPRLPGGTFILGTSELGGPDTLGPTATEFILGESKLGGGDVVR